MSYRYKPTVRKCLELIGQWKAARANKQSNWLLHIGAVRERVTYEIRSTKIEYTGKIHAIAPGARGLFELNINSSLC